MLNTQIAIIGGGLAGLTAAIHLSQKGLKVILFEKDEFPHHKVCGEYLSREILPYLESLSIDLKKLNAPVINRMKFSSVKGKIVESEMQLGGLGISRYNLDNLLYEEAKSSGCEIIHSNVTAVVFKEGHFNITASDSTEVRAEFVLGAFGKRSNIDKILNREFIQEQSGWLAVKAHYKIKPELYPINLVSLHNFKGGYCGLSRTEMDTVNVCYLATYKSFKKHKNTEEYKSKVLMKNPKLKEFFQNARLEFEKELAIAQISFDKKSLIENHVLMIGDSAGLIHPLCGNGMAMAIHSAKIASENLISFYEETDLTRSDIEDQYILEWNQNFRTRIKAGRILQKILLNQSLADFSQKIIRRFPGILPYIIKKTHGNQIYV
ncbi:NAD(P)/FAD-dependent oxidoreductase [Christiangramia sp. SM2212]|uniref:NAD(P)/FAD-dependent oxidoreductase n=1 Tax=Christiangramia sediminicola TaxID=3073267 RepID=A0ABU1EPH0_9FLAO|nr:NAD(P)/FAD-dependent oxidoreductase [Christiangramia sp. SM2212]MDR5590283.1 NAD(P)/FAD-dependent oxidoreductase [Christiangramia sp. SM2212]